MRGTGDEISENIGPRGDFLSESGVLDEDRDDLMSELEQAEAEGKIMRERIRSVFASEDGKTVAKWLTEVLCGCSKSPFSQNALQMARDAGKQEIGLMLKAILSDDE